MRRHSSGKQKILSLALALLLPLSACGVRETGPEPSASPEPEAPASSAVPPDAVRISELMAKNHAVLRDEDGDFSDWIELENYGERDADLTGWRLTDRESREGFVFPAFTLPAGCRALVFASGKDRPAYLHTGFSLSPGEEALLYDAQGRLLSRAPCLTERADASAALGEDGEYAECLYPSPGYPNSFYGYTLWQESLATAGPLVINEAVVRGTGEVRYWLVEDCDWVELKNVSDEPVELSDYYLSDDKDERLLCRLPSRLLAPGELALFRCAVPDTARAATPCLSLALDSDQEELYLSAGDRTLVDWAFLRDIPSGRSYGRLEGENGFFYLPEPSPLEDNATGFRFVSRPPRLTEPDGVFNGVSEVPVALEAPGEIYYSADPGLDFEDWERYTEPFSVESTCALRAVAVEEGGLPSRPRNLSYILNENHSLPVMSLVSDSASEFNFMYGNGIHGREIPGSLAFFEEGGGFYNGCGIRMHGQTSLTLPKKNMSVFFRGVYGEDSVDYDLYGGGLTEHASFVLRAGQDYYRSIVLNALCQNMALRCSDALISQRSRFCVLYVNGSYAGIYNLMEKPNESLYAGLHGVSRDSVTVINSEAHVGSPVYEELFDFLDEHDAADPENYRELCTRLDVDSLIDWIILQGWSANADLTYGNLRYVRSAEDDGRWRLIYYDLDASFGHSYNCFNEILRVPGMRMRQIGNKLIYPLLRSESFRDRLLTRAGELLRGPLSDGETLAELDRLAALVEPEVERDYARLGMTKAKWDSDVQNLRGLFRDDAWHENCVKMLCQIFSLDEQQRIHYFGAESHG